MAHRLFMLAMATTFAAATSTTQAAVSLGSPDDCDDGFQVVFDSFNDVNPFYDFSGVPVYGDLRVAFGSHFDGQTIGTTNNSLEITQPSDPLSLALDPTVMTAFDFANSSDIVLGGEHFKTPIAIHFDNPVSHVCFDLGHLDADSPTVIEAFTADGTSLGVIDDLSAGTQRYSVTDSSSNNVISGVSIYVPNGEMDWEGFAVSNVAFDVNVIPEPATFIIWSLLGLVVVSATCFTRKTRV